MRNITHGHIAELFAVAIDRKLMSDRQVVANCGGFCGNVERTC